MTAEGGPEDAPEAGASVRKLSLLDATLLVMGGIVGIGIFFTPQSIAERVGSTGTFLGLWGIGGVVALCAAFTFAELAGTWPRTGGWFVFLREVFGPFPAYLFAWVVLFIISSGAMAIIASFFGSQVHLLAPDLVGDVGSASHAVVALGSVAVLTVIALSGVKNAAQLQNVAMLVKLVAIAGLVVVGVVAVLGGAPRPAAPAGGAPGPGSDVVGALLKIFFSYGGWQLVCYLAPEVRDPVRNLPRAIVGGVIGVVIVYVTANVGFVGALGLHGLAADQGFVTSMASRAAGSTGVVLLTTAIAISALGVLTVNVITAPWLYVAMAREGLFFETVGSVRPGTGVPVNALLLQAALVAVYFFARPLQVLVDGVVFSEWIFHGLAALALLRARARMRALPRPFRSPLYPLAPLVYLACALVVVIGTLGTQSWSLTGPALGVIVLGAAIYLPWRRFFRTRAARPLS